MKKLLLLISLLATTVHALADTPPARNTLILVKGAAGEPEYGAKFDGQLDAWKKAATTAGADILFPATREQLEKTITETQKDGPAELWLVLIGHGTWDGKEARFNLEGPDLSTADLAAWLKPVKRPLVVIDTSSSSAPFMAPLAGAGRVIITATRSGSERNYARFGDNFAAALADPAADYDQDGQVSLLETFLRAASRTTEFYQSDGRLVTEHALIDDNGDGKGTPASWFRGLRATTKSRDNTPLDGARAHRHTLTPDPATAQLSPEQLARRDEIEAAITALRERKATLKEDEYYRQLEALLRQLASVFEKP